MPKDWFVFSNAVNKSASRWITLSTALLFLWAHPVRCEEAVDPLLSLPQVELKVVQKNANGDRYQIGDRIPLFVELTSELIQGQTTFSIKPPEGGSKIEDQGWYVDPQTLLISNNLQFVVSPIQTGKLTLPTLLILKEDKTPIARTSPFVIQVSGPDAKPQKEPSELIGPIEISLPLKYWLTLGGISLALALLSIYFVRRYLRRKRKAKPIILPTKKAQPEHLVAFQALDALYQKYPYSNENLKPVAFGISEILKQFFSNRFKIDANESTTDEMLALLRRESIPSDQLRDVQALFQELDLIKFTKQESYSFSEQHYYEFKVKAQSLVQRWAIRSANEPSAEVRS